MRVLKSNLNFVLAYLPLWFGAVQSVPTWPNEKTDRLEELLYEQHGFLAEGHAAQVVNCEGPGNFLGIGRSGGAEWLRNAYHDMATADVFAGTGGIDASVVYELDRPENVGSAFNETTDTFFPEVNRHTSLSDLFALAAVLAAGDCTNGTLDIPFRAGRRDAYGPGPAGVPQPQEDIDSHIASFKKQGFDASEMIELVACRHSVGGVHGVDFPEISPFLPSNVTIRSHLSSIRMVLTVGKKGDHTVGFDTTVNFFENRIATEFVANTSSNPLVSGQNVTTRSDDRIFRSDGGNHDWSNGGIQRLLPVDMRRLARTDDKHGSKRRIGQIAITVPYHVT